MNSPPSSSSRSFELLDERIQRWIWASGWTELKDAQERAIPVILDGSRDVIIAAATASGKTEAAFLPILTRLLHDTHPAPIALYVSPLKALINDQWGRLEALCESLEVPVTPWHGDISDTKKKRFIKRPGGCLLITPESLEGLLMSRGQGLGGLFDGLRYLVVDELHAFVDTERGKQLQSLLNRIDHALKRQIPRVGLSATLGEMRLAAEFLRPRAGDKVEIIESKESGQELKVLVKGYLALPPRLTDKSIESKLAQGQEVAKEDEVPICDHIFKSLRGSNNLVFPNSRGRVEIYSDLLRRHCERLGVPNEFWPHHGSLAKDIREEAEAALKSKERPATAICTTTLELGIDIGAVKSVAQIGAAPSVASLRQRLGRSGRRKGESAILRCYCLEAEIKSDTPLSDQLREGLVQTIAQINLLVQGWYEPPRISGMHLSTLIQQLLSLIAQYGGMTAARAWAILCESGVFAGITKSEFAELLKGLGTRDVLMQDSTGLILHGGLGEKLVNHYTFYAAFTTEEEFRIVSGGKTLGSLPVSRPVEVGGYIIFAGRRWKVVGFHATEKLIEVTPAKGGRPPLFDGMAGKVHDRVRAEMRAVLSDASPIPFLDQPASELLAEARAAYARLNLDDVSVIQFGKEARIFTWAGDWTNDTLVLMLARKDIRAANEGVCIVVFNAEFDRLQDILFDIANDTPAREEDLAQSVQNKMKEKWDGLLTEELLCKSYASRELDVEGAVVALRRIALFLGNKEAVP
jgi:ATP-dependent Lhr-like helicase